MRCLTLVSGPVSFAFCFSGLVIHNILMNRYCECSFCVHIVDLSEHFTLMLPNHFSQKFDIIPFILLLVDTVENSVFDMMGAKA